MIHPETKVHSSAIFEVSDDLTIDRYAVIGEGFKAHCRNLHIGRHAFIGDRVQVGGGGSDGPHANVTIGPECCIAEGSFINCAEEVRIGRHVAFGYETQVWTHSVWGPVIKGFPRQKQEPVFIGDEVWLPSRCQVLPGVRIGHNVIVGIGSLVNRSLPDGCFAVGRPCRVIRQHEYPKQLTVAGVRAELGHLIQQYREIAEDKGFTPTITVDAEARVHFEYNGEVVFDPWTQEFRPCPDISDQAEDFRDFLRRNGFPFYGGGFFKSITPVRFRKEKHNGYISEVGTQSIYEDRS